MNETKTQFALLHICNLPDLQPNQFFSLLENINFQLEGEHNLLLTIFA